MIVGPQGSGKSTLSRLIKSVLPKIYGRKVVVLWLDDFYLRKTVRLKLAKNIHPLLEVRGVPGTHDLKLLQDTIKKLELKKFPVHLPSFDKLKDVRTPGYTGFDYIPDEQPVDLRPITYKDFEYTDVKMPVGLEQAYMNELGLKPRDSLSNYFFKDGPKKKMVYGERKQDFSEKPINILQQLTDEYNMTQRSKQASQYPGYGGTQEPDRFMEGGIASLNVNKK